MTRIMLISTDFIRPDPQHLRHPRSILWSELLQEAFNSL